MNKEIPTYIKEAIARQEAQAQKYHNIVRQIWRQHQDLDPEKRNWLMKPAIDFKLHHLRMADHIRSEFDLPLKHPAVFEYHQGRQR